jgi:ABC-type branched-subunit amino acid transport system ATPase component
LNKKLRTKEKLKLTASFDKKPVFVKMSAMENLPTAKVGPVKKATTLEKYFEQQEAHFEEKAKDEVLKLILDTNITHRSAPIEILVKIDLLETFE